MNCLSNVLNRCWTQKDHLSFKLRSQRASNNPTLDLEIWIPDRSHRSIWDLNVKKTKNVKLRTCTYARTCTSQIYVPTHSEETEPELGRAFCMQTFHDIQPPRLGYILALVNLWLCKLHTAIGINDRGVSISFTYEINLFPILPPPKLAQLQDS